MTPAVDTTNPAYRHGHDGRGKRTPEYRCWAAIQSRCHNENDDGYEYYGARGVRVDDSWRGEGGFERFLAYVGLRPSPQHSLDRYPNNDGNYEPGNVRWATRTEQMRNTRRATLITIGDETLPTKTWCERTGVPYRTAWYRIDAGWDPARAVTEKPTNSRTVLPLQRTCASCGELFTPPKNQRGRTKTCSKPCRYRAMRASLASRRARS